MKDRVRLLPTQRQGEGGGEASVISAQLLSDAPTLFKYALYLVVQCEEGRIVLFPNALITDICPPLQFSYYRVPNY